MRNIKLHLMSSTSPYDQDKDNEIKTLKVRIGESILREEHLREMLEEKDKENVSLTVKLEDLTTCYETLIENESSLQQKVKIINKGKDKLDEIQLVQRSPIIKTGIGFNGQNKNKNGTEDCRITFVKKATKVIKPAHQSLPNKRVQLKNPVRQPQAILVKEHQTTRSKSQPSEKPADQRSKKADHYAPSK